MKSSSPTCSFPLRSDFHCEVGWRNWVRDQASLNPQAIRQIIDHRMRYDFGPDPRALMERWEPYTMCLFYFWTIRQGETSPSFVATDGIFSMVIGPLPRDEHLSGLPEELLELASEIVVAAGGSANVSPLMPIPLVDGPAQDNVLADQLVVHRYADGLAYLRPCILTLRGLAADPIGWADSEATKRAFHFYPTSSKDRVGRPRPPWGDGGVTE